MRYVALSGPEEGAVFPGSASWFAHAGYLAVTPAWGHYLVPGSTYAISYWVNQFGANTVDAFADSVKISNSVGGSNSASQWFNFTGSFVATSTTTSIRLVNNGAGNKFLDDVVLTKVN